MKWKLEKTPQKTVLDRVAMAFMGVVAGAFYGVCLAFCVLLLTGQWAALLMVWSAVVFGAIGFLYDNVLVEGVLMLVHFLYGFFISDQDWMPPHREFAQPKRLHIAMLIGFGTGLVFCGWWW